MTINGPVIFLAIGVLICLWLAWLCKTTPVHDSRDHREPVPHEQVLEPFPCPGATCQYAHIPRHGHARFVPLADLTADLTDEGIDKLIKESR